MSFRFKTILGLVLILTLIVITLVGSQAHYYRSSSEAELYKHVSQSAKNYALSIKSALITSDIAALNELARHVISNDGVKTIKISQSDGLVLSAAENDLVGDSIAVSVPIEEGGISFGVLELAMSSEYINTALAKSIRVQVFIAALGLVAAIVFAWALGVYLTRRIKALTFAVSRISNGELGFALDTQGVKDEFAETLNAFNEMSAKLRASELRKSALFQAAVDGIFILDECGRIVDYNAAATNLFAIDGVDIRGEKISTLVDFVGDLSQEGNLGDTKSFFSMVESRLDTCFETVAISRADRRSLPVEITLSRVTLDSGDCYAAYVRNITVRKQAEEKLNYLAFYDDLTGVPNRPGLREKLQKLVLNADKKGRRIALVLLGVDRFKNINDSLGHDVGDKMVKAISQRLQEIVRRGDIVGRMGGDEFAIILDDMRGADDVYQIIEKILESMTKPFTVDAKELFVNSSMGVALYPDDNRDIDGLMRNADTAMSQAKLRGGNQYRYYSREMSEHVRERLHLENELRRALTRDQLLVYFQPQVDIQSNQIIGAEALLRWKHPELGLVSPIKFIPLAEETGLIDSIGDWVLKEACSNIRGFYDSGLPSLQVAINLSARQFRRQDFAKHIGKILLQSGLAPKLVELEITESILLENAQHVADVLKELHSYGIRIALDDFGTGYSSLNYLKRFPIDVLKIDRSFIADIGKDAEDERIVSAIITMAHDLGIEVVAEGVETEQQLHFIKERSVRKIQGYYFSPPVPAASFMKLVQQGTKFANKKSIS